MNALLMKVASFFLKFALDKFLLETASRIVSEIAEELPNLADGKKRDEAVMRIKKELKKVGKDAKTKLVNLAVELAVNQIKKGEK